MSVSPKPFNAALERLERQIDDRCLDHCYRRSSVTMIAVDKAIRAGLILWKGGMLAKNKTKNVVLSDNVLMLKTLAEKTNGLIAMDDAKKAVFFETRFGIHTFGMGRPLDCLILDDLGYVRRLKENLQPNKTFFWPPLWKKVVELPAGKVRETGTAIGDKISIV